MRAGRPRSRTDSAAGAPRHAQPQEWPHCAIRKEFVSERDLNPCVWLDLSERDCPGRSWPTLEKRVLRGTPEGDAHRMTISTRPAEIRPASRGAADAMVIHVL